MDPTEFLTARVEVLEADLETLRPIAEQHSIAAVKHIGLREIPQAVSEVFAEVKEKLRLSEESDLIKRIKEAALKCAGDYPNLANVSPYEQVYAIEASYLGTNSACSDLHEILTAFVRAAKIAEDALCRATFPGPRDKRDLNYAIDELRNALRKATGEQVAS